MNVPISSIATSSGQNDSGMFELNFKDERYMPFEGAGAVSKWRLEMMKRSLSQFDYDTISDVILHIRYTSKEDSALKTSCVGNLKALTTALGETPFTRMFSLRHDFPNQWNIWKQGGALSIDISKERHFAYWVQGRVVAINNISMYVDYNTGGWNQTPVAISPFSLPLGSGNLQVDDSLDSILLGGRGTLNDVFLFLNFSLNRIT